ncbi:MAG: hypothetical protein KBD04_05895 [Proteobacteria bacterium]|nr:hypothetical protein [Pseudomonadota bacterium]
MAELIVEMKDLEKKFLNSEMHRKIFQIYLPGLSKEREDRLKLNIVDLPESYLDVARRYNLLNVSVGMFSLWPGGRFKTLEDSVIDALNDSFFPKEFMEKHRMYQVGSYNTDLICVTVGTDQFANGEVLFVDEGFDIYNPEDSQVHHLAKDFEQFILVAANLGRDGVNADSKEFPAKKQEFLDRLKRLGVDEKYRDIWLSLF